MNIRIWWTTVICIIVSVCTALYIHQTHAAEHYEMNQAETARLVRALDTALTQRQVAQQATDAYNALMAETRKAHGWPDDLIFDGAEWKHAPKPAGPSKAETKSIAPQK